MITHAVAVILLLQSSEKPALNGLDPVALTQGQELDGKSHLTAKYLRHTYTFATQENLDRFLQNKLQFSIQQGGACGSMGPLSGKGDPSRFTVANKRIYIFASEGCRTRFTNNLEEFVAPVPEAIPLTGDSKESGLDAWRAARQAHGIPKSPKLSLVWINDQSYQQDGETKVWREKHTLTSLDSFYQHQYNMGTPGFRTGLEGSFSYETANNESYRLHPTERRALRAKFMRHPYAILTAPEICIQTGQFNRENIVPGTESSFLISIKGISTRVHLDPKTKLISYISFTDYRGGKLQSQVQVFDGYQAVQGVKIPTSWTNGIKSGVDTKFADPSRVQTYFIEPVFEMSSWIPKSFDPVNPDISP